MGLTFQRFHDGITYFISLCVTGIGVMTFSEKLGFAGLLLGILSGIRAWVHRARMEKAQRQRNALIEQLLHQAENRDLSQAERHVLQQLTPGADDESR